MHTRTDSMEAAMDFTIKRGLARKARDAEPSEGLKARVKAALAASAEMAPVSPTATPTRLADANTTANPATAADPHSGSDADFKPDATQAPRAKARVIAWGKPASASWWTRARVAAAVAACCVLGVGTAFALGGLDMLTSHAYRLDEVTSYQQMANLADQAGLSANLPETFDNGYAFASAVPVQNEGRDADGNVILAYDSVDATYTRDGSADVNVSAEPYDDQVHEPMGAHAMSQRSLNGATVYYSRDEYLIAPAREDFQLTPEQQQRLETDDHFVVSYGDPDQDPRSTIFDHASLRVGNTVYVLSAFDADAATIEDDLYAMAAQIAQAEG